jgi:hypothetical protein
MHVGLHVFVPVQHPIIPNSAVLIRSMPESPSNCPHHHLVPHPMSNEYSNQIAGHRDHSDHDDFAEANRTHFDKLATVYDDLPHVTEFAHKIAQAMRSVYQFIDDQTVVMDFACGTGTTISTHHMQ